MYMNKEIEKEKNEAIRKKKLEKEAMKRTVIENETNKKLQIEMLKKERRDDIKAAEDYTKILDKQEQTRKDYFAKIERNANSFMSNVANGVLKEMDNRNKQDEERMSRQLKLKEDQYLIIINF